MDCLVFKVIIDDVDYLYDNDYHLQMQIISYLLHYSEK